MERHAFSIGAQLANPLPRQGLPVFHSGNPVADQAIPLEYTLRPMLIRTDLAHRFATATRQLQLCVHNSQVKQRRDSSFGLSPSRDDLQLASVVLNLLDEVVNH